MEGSATFTMKKSRTIMYVPIISTDSGAHAPGTSGLGVALDEMPPVGVRRTVTRQGWTLPRRESQAPELLLLTFLAGAT